MTRTHSSKTASALLAAASSLALALTLSFTLSFTTACAHQTDYSTLFARDGDILLALGPESSYASLGPYQPVATLDTSGNPISLPRGALSFADEVVAYHPGGGGLVPEGRFPNAALGAPDYTGGAFLNGPTAVTLGSGGSITLRFTDNALVDVEGPDLYVYEVGPNVEATFVDISADGKQWIRAGKIGGSASSIDIRRAAAPDQAYPYVRLTDDPSQGVYAGDWPGADIDAVAAVGSAERIELPSEVLFEHDSDVLLAAAAPSLDAAAARILAREGARATVLGHTDDTGEDTYNLDLSRRRAAAVARYLTEKGVPKERITTEGHGESRPAADNATEEGRRRNRRVEILIQDR
jgi:outer membrane protein OmpA-like peptidoglycan-associated protein